MTGTDDRRRVWDMPGGRMLEQQFIQNGYGDLVRVVDAHLGIDTAAMKGAALDIYGMATMYDTPVSLGPMNPAEVDPARGLPGNAAIPSGLEEMARRVPLVMARTVQDEWEGGAYRAFESYISRLATVTEHEAASLRRIGDALWTVADGIEKGQGDVEASIAGAAGLGLAVGGFAGASGIGILIAVVGAVAAAYASWADVSDRAATEAEAATDATLAVTLPVAAALSPQERLPRYSRDPEDWEPRDG